MLIIILMVRAWKISTTRVEEIWFDDRLSLDAITRQLPDGYYSTFRTYAERTRVVGLSTHLRRLPDIDASFLRRQLIGLLEHFRPSSRASKVLREGETASEARVRVILTYQGQLYVAIEPLILLPRNIYENGVHVETIFIQRSHPREKSTAFIGQSDKERRLIAEKGIFEALLVKNGRILEGMTSNFFYIQDGILYTAQRGVLQGVTRRTVIQVARGEGVGVRYKSLQLKQLPAVDEAFLTSSSRGVVPVIQVDNVRVGRGMVGFITKRIAAAYETDVINNAEKI